MEFKSYAKVNLYLDILNKREDAYHNIDTLFSSISLYDSIHINHTASNPSNAPVLKRISFECVSKYEDELLFSKENIVWKAIEKLEPYINKLEGSLHIRLVKNIPIGAGLGGGSSNAASVMLALNKYLSLGLSLEKLTQISALLGSDVAFFIKGGLARGEDRGEKLSFCNFPYFFHTVIVYPDIKLSSKEAYTNYAVPKTRLDNKENISNIINSLERKDLSSLSKYMYNSFEETQFKRYPFLKEIKEDFLKMGARASLMSGSGSSIFAIFSSIGTAFKSYQFMKHRYNKVFIETSKSKY